MQIKAIYMVSALSAVTLGTSQAQDATNPAQGALAVYFGTYNGRTSRPRHSRALPQGPTPPLDGHLSIDCPANPSNLTAAPPVAVPAPPVAVSVVAIPLPPAKPTLAVSKANELPDPADITPPISLVGTTAPFQVKLGSLALSSGDTA
ncbi:hypothetical protein BGX26_010789 [Mortierella sp. AD094]|nr:hypothetical protein BGX26_010789 [Mortierella sp. AD094]